MGKYINKEDVGQRFRQAMKASIGRSTVSHEQGVVQLSKFKRENIVELIPREFLPNDPMVLINCPFWDHLAGHIPKVFLDEMNQATTEVVRELVTAQLVEMGGQRENLTYPPDDWALVTIAGRTAP